MLVTQKPIFCRFVALALLCGWSTVGVAPELSAQPDEIQQLEKFLTPESQPAPASVRPANLAPPEPSTFREPQESVKTASDGLDEESTDGTVTVESRNVAIKTTSAPRLDLGPELGDGEFLVLMTYEGEGSLRQAQQHSEGAFITRFNGTQYIQLAVFDQLEYARHMANSLRRQGIPAVVTY